MTKFSLLKAVASATTERIATNAIIVESFSVLAAENNTTSEALVEGVTHVLANIANAASSGEDLKVMNADSISAFFAGVERIATMLPQAQDGDKKANTIRVLTAAGIGKDGHVTSAVAPIAQLGARDETLRQKYAEIVKQYLASVHRQQPDGRMLVAAARKLQQMIDQAMNTQATQPQVQRPNTMRARLA